MSKGTAMNRRTLEQQRAYAAWEAVTEVKQAVTQVKQKEAKQKDFHVKYRSLARNLPSMILSNGLGATLAFIKSKGSAEHQKIYTHLDQWLTRWIRSWLNNAVSQGILEWIVAESTSETYRMVTTEALAFTQWLKRFAESEIPDEQSGA